MRNRDYWLLREAWGNWLAHQWKWEWFVSLTFRDSQVGRGKAGALWSSWLGELVKSTGKDVGFVRVTEFQKYRGIPHYHALMLNLEGVKRLKWLDKWVALAGWARVLEYDPRKGAAHYLCKYVSKEMGEVLFSDNIQDFKIGTHRPEQLKLFC